MKKKVICVTSSRADYGLQKKLFNLLKDDNQIDSHLLVTGNHFIAEHGNSFKEVFKDKFYDKKKIIKFPNKLEISSDYLINTFQIKLHSYLKKEKPSLIILLGDRLEIYLLAIIANILEIKIVHISGGETTLGSKDDNYRDCITRLSNFHFVSHKIFKDRVKLLNKKNENIYVVGSLGVENIYSSIKKNTPIHIDKKYLSLNNFFLVNLHPVLSEMEFHFNIINTLSHFKDNAQFLFTSPNIDQGGKKLYKKIFNEVKKNKNFFFEANLGQDLYFYLLKKAKGVIGNSSSGIIEVPIFKIPTFNIGSRQDGRLKSSTIIDVKNYKMIKNLTKIIKKINSNSFKLDSSNIIFKNSNTSKKIYNQIIVLLK